MKNAEKKCTAIVLSAGQGKRMNTAVQKQYIELGGKPVIYYSLKAFQDSAFIDEIILVVGAGQEEYVRTEIVEKYQITKVTAVAVGGKERYDSVWSGLSVLKKRESAAGAGKRYVFIHDGARPFVDEEMIRRGYETVEKYRACVAGMPSKDTIKLVDEINVVQHTPQRKYVWAVQTPQIFEQDLIVESYERLMRAEKTGVTDDAMVVEKMKGVPVRLFEGSYENIKITTPEDLDVAEVFLKRKYEKLINSY